MSKVIHELDQSSMRTDLPAFRPGDTVKVHVKVVEGNRSRIQVFTGVVISRAGRWHSRNIHRTQGELRRRRGADVPAAQPDH